MASEGSNKTLREEILYVLEYELGGEVKDPQGYAVRRIFERIASVSNYASVSSEVGLMDKDGIIIRDMPSKKRTTRVALPQYSSHPPRKALSVVMEHLSSTMVEMLQDQVHHVIESESQFKAESLTEEAVDEMRDGYETQISELKAQVKSLRAQVHRGTSHLEQQIEQLKAENAELYEEKRVLEHNVEVWKNNALKRPVVREMLAAVKDRLDPKTRVELERLMRELPATRVD